MKNINDKIRKSNTLILDVDGVLTDGTITYDNNGKKQKSFHVQDGKGISLAKVAGMKVFLMTSDTTELIKKLEIGDNTYLGVRNKRKCLEKLIAKNNLSFENIAFIGDDINDIPVLDRVGLPIAVNDAIEEVKDLVKKRGGVIMTKNGGKGAVREAIEMILKGQRIWKKVIEKDLQRQLNEEW